MNQFRVLLAANLKSARKRLGYSQMRLAQIIGVSTSFIGEIEICRKFPSSTVMQKLSEALNLRPYQLFLDEGPGHGDLGDDQIRAVREQLKQRLNNDVDAVINSYFGL